MLATTIIYVYFLFILGKLIIFKILKINENIKNENIKNLSAFFL